MRIVHVLVGRCNPHGANGVDVSVSSLSKSQVEAGHDVSLFCLTEKECLPIGGVTLRGFAPSANPFTLPSSLTKAIEEVKPVVVHLHSVYLPQNISLARYARHKGIPYVVSPHGGLSPLASQRNKVLKKAFNHLFAYSFWAGAAFIHALSEVEVEHLRMNDIIRPIVVAPNGINGIDLPDPTTLDRTCLEKLYPQTKGKRVFMFVGRLDPVFKGLDLLFEACYKVRQALREVVLVVIGQDWRGSQSKLQKQVIKLGLERQVIFTGPKYGEDKFAMLAACDVFVHPSRSEAMPFAPLEALAMQKPCLITKSTGFGDFFQKYHVGLRVEPTVDGIAEGLRHFAEITSEELKQVGTQSRQAVLQEFRWERTAQLLCQAYQQHSNGC
jgi:glycosyltransferase involved in cell wall biosynthesis